MYEFLKKQEKQRLEDLKQQEKQQEDFKIFLENIEWQEERFAKLLEYLTKNDSVNFNIFLQDLEINSVG